MFITLFLGLLIRVNALPGSTWVNVLDALLTITNCSTSIASLFFVFRTREPWKHKLLSLSVARLWASCCRRGPGRHGDPVHANTHAGRDLPLDAPMMPSPSTVFRFHQQPLPSSSASAKVHIGPSSEKSVAVEFQHTASPVSASFPEATGIKAQGQELDQAQGQEGHDTHYVSGTSVRTSLLRPTETTDQKAGANPLRTSIKEHLVALSVSGKELVDRLSSSGKAPAADHLRSTLAREVQNEVESQQSLLAVLALDREEESQLDAHHTVPVQNPLLPPVEHIAASPFVHRDISRQQEQKGRRS